MATHKRICPICEAACSLEVELQGDVIASIRANKADTFSQGHSCAKGLALKELHDDPDRLKTPLVKNSQGRLVPSTWTEAFAKVDQGLSSVRDRFGPHAIATYIGNPTAHNIGLSLGLGAFLGALKSTSVFSAGSVDQLPKQLASELMFGNGDAIPVPDIERTDLLVILGANPVVSNGSLWVVPGIRQKLRSLRKRGGRCIVVDPRFSETARLADVHHFIRPGTDAWLLAALCSELIAQGCQPAVPSSGFTKLAAALKPFSLEQAEARTGISTQAIAQLTKDLMAAQSAAIYGRVGTTLQRFGTLTSFLIEVANALTHNLDQAGGAMFPEQAFAYPESDKSSLAYARYHSRVSGYPEVLGQLPVACLAEEMDTSGVGQIRALVTLAGNPLVSNPDPERLGCALEGLEFRVSLDIYHNETSSLADVVLPGTSPFEKSHYDQFLGAMTYKNTARYSEALLSTHLSTQFGFDEWRVMLQLAHIVDGKGVADDAQLDAYEDAFIAAAVQAYLTADSVLAERLTVAEIVGQLSRHGGVDRMLDLGIRFGPWGDQFGGETGITLQQLIETPDSLEMGPLQPRLDEIVQHADGLLDLAPEVILSDLQRLVQTPESSELLLIGRRHPNTNNSWLHNLPMLSRGQDRAVLEMHPLDAQLRQISDGDQVRIGSQAGELAASVSLTDTLMPGVVSMPHGYSDYAKSQQQVARSGPNSNVLAPADYVDVPSATVALNGIPVVVTPL